jgi:hypothetical protein
MATVFVWPPGRRRRRRRRIPLILAGIIWKNKVEVARWSYWMFAKWH